MDALSLAASAVAILQTVNNILAPLAARRKISGIEILVLVDELKDNSDYMRSLSTPRTEQVARIAGEADEGFNEIQRLYKQERGGHSGLLKISAYILAARRRQVRTQKLAKRLAREIHLVYLEM
jgi:hypothetical protein